jgi:hypothetical protein
LCKLCVDNKCVLPSIESVTRRFEDPKAYCIFYMYFYTAAVGEVRWKECLSKEEGRIGNNTTEAFAMLVLVNHYKAWLYEEKKVHQVNLLTEYDCPPSYGKTSIVDKILDGVQFNLEKEASPNVIYDKEDRNYKKLEKKRVEWLEEFCKTEPCLETKDGVLKKALIESDGSSNEAEAEEDLFDQKEKDRKRRKLTRGLRKYTGVAPEGERKTKGWSDRGMVAFERWVGAILEDVNDDKYVAWEKAYRGVMKRIGNYRKDIEEPLQPPRYEPNLGVVWEGL